VRDDKIRKRGNTRIARSDGYGRDKKNNARIAKAAEELRKSVIFAPNM
jgi:hypothetical protein